MPRLSFRWQQVVPRLLLVIVAALGLQFALGVAAKWMAIRRGEAALSTNVEIATARVSILDRQLLFGELRVANPRRPEHNLLEADCCVLDLAAAPLLSQRVEIDRGQITGLRIAASSGQSTTTCAEEQPAASINWLDGNAELKVREWLTEASLKFNHPSSKGFESVRMAEAVCVRWPKDSSALIERAASLKRRAELLQQTAATADANPLRHAEVIRDLPARASSLERALEEFSEEIEGFAASMDAKRRSIRDALERDDRQVREKLQFAPMDAEALTAYLFRDQLAVPLEELIGWLRWARQVVPAGLGAPQALPPGGDVLITANRAAPNFLIRALQLQGTANLGGQPVEVGGLLCDVTNDPMRHNVPIRLRLASAGPHPLELRATIDRTGPVARDELLLDCQGVGLPELFLGRSDELQVRIAPSTGSLSISLVVEGEKLRGDVQLVQSKVTVRPVVRGGLSSLQLSSPLQETLGKLDFVATRLSLQGTLDDPSCTLWSNLGPALAEAMDRAVRAAGDERADAVLADARLQVQERLVELDREFHGQQSKLQTLMSNAGERINAIALRHASRERITREALNQTRPETSLLR